MIPLVSPSISWKDREYVKGRIDEGLLEDEREVRTLEEEFAERFGYAAAVATNSGTTALIVALETLKRVRREWGYERDRVAIPSYCCRAVWDACLAAGLRPVLRDNAYDVVNADYHMTNLYAPLAVLPHMFGRAANVAVGAIVEDLTLSLGAKYSPHNLAVVSLNRDKMISAGRGGMILIPNGLVDVADQIRRSVHYDAHPSDLEYAHSFAMSSTQAALALSQLRRLDGMIQRRRDLAAYYTDRLGDWYDVPRTDNGNVFFRYLIAVHDPAEAVVKLAERGIEAGRGVYPPIHTIVRADREKFPGAEQCVSSLLSLPVHPEIREPARIVDEVMSVCEPA